MGQDNRNEDLVLLFSQIACPIDLIDVESSHEQEMVTRSMRG